jgi:steroid delta-isomerase-like uncharacterized protein
MSEQNTTAVRRFYEAINAGNLGIIDELVATDFVEHEEFQGLEPNREGTRQMFAMMRAAFPDLRLEMDAVLADGDMVVVRGRMTGTHRGEFAGMAPTGKQINTPFADFVRFQDGKAVEHWGVTDSGAMMQQLGAGPPQ